MGLKDKLSVLNRQFREIEIQSLDKTSKEVGYYRRPTEIEDSILRKAMNEEYETILGGLKEGETSVYHTMIDLFKNASTEAAVNTLIASQADDIRAQSARELGKLEPDADTSKEDREAYIEELKPIFERKVEELRKVLNMEPEDVLPMKAAQTRIETIARDRAFEIYRRRLIAQSLYEKDDATDKFELVFAKHEEVPESLDTDTINTIAKAIIDEMNRVKNLPLK
jgi:hypothetical protein